MELTLDATRFERLRAIVLEAAALPAAERTAFLERACGGDAELRRQADSLLEQREMGTEPLAAPLQRAAGELLENTTSLDRVGPYRCVRLLGEGGMGQVWLAEQSEPVQRQVALKVIKWGMDTRSVVRRFEAERQALAIMDHPAIARVFDAGATPDGRPYFVMEYVPGAPITEFCDRAGLSTRERLELLLAVCQGVQHAHQKGIIHRDIKPSNVLVALQDERPVPKIIDFGVAKAIEHRLTERTLYTEQGLLIGTPEYMSPEQAGLPGADVDTRTDVYSLGVLFYELLSGALPIEPQRLRQEGLAETLRYIREQEPPRPSARVSSLGEASAEAARRRRTNPRSLARTLRGELDWIALRALAKDRERRYGSPSEMGADIRRHLDGRPVLAGPPSVVYTLRKFVQRHRLGVSLLALTVVALAGFGVRERIQRQNITLERDRANRVSTFLTELFVSKDPNQAQGQAVTVEEVLHRGAERIRQGLADDPEVQAHLMQTIARVYTNLAHYESAEALVRDALEIRRRRLGEEHELTLQSMSLLARVLGETAQFDEASELLRRTIDGRTRTLGPEHSHTLVSIKRLSRLLWQLGRYDEGERLALRVIEALERTLGPEHGNTLGAKNELAGMYRSQGRYEEALALMREVLEGRKRVTGEDHPATLTNMNNMGIVLVDLKRFDEAEAVYKEVLERRRRVMGPDHPATFATMHTLALLYDRQGRYDEAEPLAMEATEARARLLGEDHPETLRSKNTLALIHRHQGRLDEAERIFREVLEGQRRRLGPEHPDTFSSLGNLADVARRQGQLAEAERLHSESLTGRRKTLGPEHEFTLTSMSKLASIYRRRGNYDAATGLFLELLEIRKRLDGADSPATGVVLYDLACVAALRGDSARALDWLEQSVEAGYRKADWIARDPDLESLHGDPVFEELVRRARS